MSPISSMADTNREKLSPLLILLSLLLHAGLLALVISLPQQDKKSQPSEPYMVELRDLPLPEPRREQVSPKKEISERLVPRKGPPAAPNERTLQPAVSSRRPPDVSPLPRREELAEKRDENGMQREARKQAPAATPLPPGEVIVRRKREPLPDLSKLFPGAEQLTEMEETYQRKYGESADGDTLFLHNGNEVVDSFSERLHQALQSRWVAVVRPLMKSNRVSGWGLGLVTMNRSGMVEEVRVVESSGKSPLDEAFITTIRTADYTGPLPKRWPHDKLRLYIIFSAEIIY